MQVQDARLNIQLKVSRAATKQRGTMVPLTQSLNQEQWEWLALRRLGFSRNHLTIAEACFLLGLPSARVRGMIGTDLQPIGADRVTKASVIGYMVSEHYFTPDGEKSARRLIRKETN